jgi:hypothetical protein
MERQELIQQATRELEMPVPRKVRLRPFSEVNGLWTRYFLIFLFLLALFSVEFYFNFIALLARQFGLPCQATVTAMWITQSRRSGEYDHLQVQYLVQGQPVTGTIGVSLGTYRQLSTGTAVNIHYLPLFPGRPGLDTDPGPLTGVLVSFIFSVAILGAILFKFINDRNLLIRGKVVKGSLTRRISRSWEVEYFYQEKTHIIQMIANYYGGQNEPGNSVVVLVDPDKPERNIIYDPSNCIWIPEKDLF